MKYSKISELVEIAAIANRQFEVDCHFSIEVDGQECNVYSASIAGRDILLFTDRGTVTLLVDKYGDRHVAELFDWDLEGEEK